MVRERKKGQLLMHKILGQNTSLIIRDGGNMKTMAPIMVLRLHFRQISALPVLCVVQVSGRRRRAMGPWPPLWHNPSSELWQTPAVLLPCLASF